MSDDHPVAKRRWRAADIAFFAFLMVYAGGGLAILLQGLGAVAASMSPALHAWMHYHDLGTGMAARSFKRMADSSHSLQSPAEIVLDFGFSAFNIALAGLLLWLRPHDRTARLLALGMVGAAGVFNLEAQTTFEGVPLNTIESVLQSVAHLTAGVSYALALLLFPDGRLVPRWRPIAVAPLYLPFIAAAIILALRVEGTARPATLLIFFGLVTPIAGVAAQAYRFRRAQTSAEHQQARLLFWALLPALGVGLYFLTTQGFGAATVDTLAGRGLVEVPAVVFRLFQPVFAIIPLAIFAGLLHYRLWDIDRVVNRTVVYGALTAILAALYLAVVLLLQPLFRPLTTGSDISVVISTLAVAAAFRPVRQRVQTFVDRRFYRHRYDAAQTVEAFSARLRDEIDIGTLTAELERVVRDTVQPSSVSLWLRGPDSTGPRADLEIRAAAAATVEATVQAVGAARSITDDSGEDDSGPGMHNGNARAAARNGVGDDSETVVR